MNAGSQKKKMPLHIQIILGLVAGTIWAFVSSYLGWSEFTIDWIAPFGTIFINLLKLIAVPLVLFSIIKGISELSDTTRLGTMGLKTLTAYLTTTVFAVGVGLLLVNTLKPGDYVSEEQRTINRISYEMWVAETDGVEILDGKSYLTDPKYAQYMDEATAKLAELSSNEKIKSKMDEMNEKESKPLDFVVDMVPSNIFLSLGNNKLMLQIIFFAIFFGVVLVSLPREKVSGVTSFVDGANEIFLKMVDVVMKAAPFFVFALLAGKLGEIAGDDPGKVVQVFKGLASYSIVVIIGLFIMAFGVYPVLVTLLTKKHNWKSFLAGVKEAQILAFSTSSSAATLPVTMECVRDRLGVSKEITSFVLPIGATVNMDGTSLYQAVAVIFLAQFHMVDLDLTQQLTIILTATLASIGSAAVPSAGLIMLIVVLQSVGLNPAWIAIIFPVDRILDMCRTIVNVTGDAAVSTIIASSEGEIRDVEILD